MTDDGGGDGAEREGEGGDPVEPPRRESDVSLRRASPAEAHGPPDFRVLFESAPGLYLVLRPDPPRFTIVAVSDAYLHATMTRRERILGRGLFDVFPDDPDDPSASGERNLRASLDRVVETRQADAMAVQRYAIQEGGGFVERHWSPVNLPVLNPDGTLRYIIHRVENVTDYVQMKARDVERNRRASQMESEIYRRAQQLQAANEQLRRVVTEKRALLDQLEARNRELEVATSAKSSFLAMMSHEIRTPLNAVIGMAGLLSDTSLTDEQREFASIIRSSGDHLLTVINDTLDYSKLESGHMQLERVPFGVASVVEEALDLVSASARNKDLELAYELVGDVPAMVRSDPGRVRQILVNYLANAVKFTAAGEVVVTVAARPATDGRRELHFTVRDTGVGIPADRLDRLFRPFSQVDSSTHRSYGGTGLGLAICHRLAGLLGGRTWVESTVGEGSAFHATVVVDQHDEATRVPWSAPETSPLSGLRAWVVDDNATSRRIVRDQLRRWGMSTRDTASAKEALGWAERGDRYDLAVLDFHMPEMTGVALARALRALGGAAKHVLLTSGTPTTVGNRESTGVDAQITKPVKLSGLTDCLLGLFDKRSEASPRSPRWTLPRDLAERSPLRILVAEDNSVNVKLINAMLQRLGYRADVAGNGLEAIAALRRQPYDAVLMDIQMPEMDGIEATREIHREWEASRRPRIIALTAGVMPEERDAAIAAGMDEFLDKPVVPSHLLEALARCRRLPEPGAPDDRPPAHRPSAPPSPPLALERATVDGLTDILGVDGFSSLVSHYRSDATRLVGSLREALSEGNSRAVAEAAHTLKSSSGDFGVAELMRRCAVLEQLARAGDLRGADKHFAQIEALVPRACSVLADEVAALQRRG